MFDTLKTQQFITSTKKGAVTAHDCQQNNSKGYDMWTHMNGSVFFFLLGFCMIDCDFSALTPHSDIFLCI